SILGKTPRSNPAVYIGAFDDIRELFAQSEVARRRGLNASAFSFNSSQGQCERCRGAGYEKIEMRFLSDVFIRCPDCNGRRYRAHILEVKISPNSQRASTLERSASPHSRHPERTATTQPRVARNELPWDSRAKDTYPERVPSKRGRKIARSAKMPPAELREKSRATLHAIRSFSIADLLDATIEEAVDFLSTFP